MTTTARLLAAAFLLTVTVAVDPTAAGDKQGDERMNIDVSSPAFEPGEPIPKKYSGEGDDVSPPLVWSEPPAGTKQLALICDDPDAPTPQPWVHWIAYGISADAGGLAEGVSTGITEGRNSWGRNDYGGPMPPKGHGVHHYHFKVFALDEELGAEAGLEKQALLDAIDGHVIAEGELIGTYERE